MFVQKFFTPWACHLEKKFLCNLPSELRDLGLNKKLENGENGKSGHSSLQQNMIPKPDLTQYVFLRVLETIDNFAFDDMYSSLPNPQGSPNPGKRRHLPDALRQDKKLI